ncbi:MAG TPA: DUF6011 domain-containing protein [Streptosporangiaceae bacterium]|nr:DUF6011 domain-containing protein [Streptosporangiaceae bacterium]
MSNTAECRTARCLRPGCGRKLTAPASVAAGYGPRCLARIRKAAIETAFAGFTLAQRGKAAELIADGGLVPTSRPGVYRASSSSGDVTYLVHSAMCTCPAGMHERPCYHVAAVRVLNAVRKAA